MLSKAFYLVNETFLTGVLEKQWLLQFHNGSAQYIGLSKGENNSCSASVRQRLTVYQANSEAGRVPGPSVCLAQDLFAVVTAQSVLRPF